MKTKLYDLAVIVSLSFLAETASSQVFGNNIVGYVNFAFNSGDTLFENPLLNTPDTLTNLFNQSIPNGTTISLWNSRTSTFDTTSTYLNGNWTLDLTLEPGTGAQLNAPSAFINTFIGTALNHDGTVLSAPNGLTPPPVFSGPSGTYLLGDMAPVADTGTDIFLNLFGRLPNIGEQITTLSGTSTYLGNGDWDTTPSLAVGQAAFFTIESVPEPSVFTLFCLCGLFIAWRRSAPANRRNHSPSALAVLRGRP